MLVSVIIPTYNRKDYLQQAINSVLLQSHQDIEIIVVDDGSDPEQRLQKSRIIHEEIKYYYRSHRGAAAARNYGVSVSSGEYIAFLDSDDLWDKNKLAKQLRYLGEHPEFDICYTNERWVRNGEYLNQMKKHQKYHGWIFDKCLPLCIISASSILMKKSVFCDLGGFDESLPVCEDYDLWLRTALHYPIAFIDEQLVIKRGGHKDQLSRKYWGMDRFRIVALEKLLKMGLNEQQRKMIKKEMSFKYDVLIKGSLNRGRIFRWLYYNIKKRQALRK